MLGAKRDAILGRDAAVRNWALSVLARAGEGVASPHVLAGILTGDGVFRGQYRDDMVVLAAGVALARGVY